MSTAKDVEDQWRRDIGKIIAGWLGASILAIALLLTVIKWFFV